MKMIAIGAKQFKIHHQVKKGGGENKGDRSSIFDGDDNAGIERGWRK